VNGDGTVTHGGFTAYGDIDDVIMFTARSTGRPFVGRSPVGTIESHDAEIIYWTNWDDSDSNGEVNLGEVSLHRRVLLIRPDLDLTGLDGPYTSLTTALLQTFYADYDLSVHPEVITVNNNNMIQLVTNSLADLATRENRVAHLPPGPIQPDTTFFPLSQHFPNFFNRDWLPPTDDVVIADVLAFDIRAYDPTALLRQADVSGNPGGNLLKPGDVGWDTVAHNVGQGAFVDLAYLSNYSPAPSVSSWFSDEPSTLSQLAGAPLVPTYDTWTWAYEHDGVDQDNDSPTLVDEATDGLDGTHLNPMTGNLANQINGVDDLGERETLPPYAAPLRGIQITLRVIELDTRQVRQSSIVSRLMPE
jgi:hypothetical protein